MNSTPQPPKLLLRFFRWFCHPDYVEDIEGDLLERFEKRVEEKGIRRARWQFVRDVLLLFRPGIIPPAGGTYRMNHYGMFKNYFKVIWRNLVKYKMYAFLNIGGLTLGLCCFLLIFLFVRHENSFDNFYPNSNNIYRVYLRQPGNLAMGTDYFAVTPAGLPKVLMTDYPEVAHATSVANPYILLKSKRSEFFSEKGVMADTNFFQVFEHQFLHGDKNTALKGLDDIVITRTLSEKLFPGENPMGQEVSYWGRTAFVSAVIEDLPSNSSIQFTCLIDIRHSSQYQSEVVESEWNGNAYRTYLTLNPGATAEELAPKMMQVIEKYWIATGVPSEYHISPLTDMHLQPRMNAEVDQKGNPAQLILFSIIAVFVLALACVNYMNLAIARSINRAKEVGLRKVIGAAKKQLILQFLGESIFLVLIALFLAIVLVALLLPAFGDLVNREFQLSIGVFMDWIPLLLILVIVVGIFSGSYPAFFMSSMKPAIVLKGKLSNQTSTQNLQKILIVGQYAISATMIICSLIIYLQFQFIQDKELGYEKEHVVAIPIHDNNTRDNLQVIKQELTADPNILSISASSSLPTNVRSSTFLYNDLSGPNIYRLYIDTAFLNIYDIELLAGRNFSSDFADQTLNNYIINETAAKALGWTPAEAIGQKFVNEEGMTKTVIGVVRDFHMHSMHQKIAPLMIAMRDDIGFLSVKIRPFQIEESLAFLNEVFRQYSARSFEYKFVDDHFDQLYKTDVRQAEIFGVFTAIAILIACLGLFGLAAFNAHQRIKEIGIRKVLGASVPNIVSMFALNFIRLTLLGFFIAIPIAWYAMNGWLEGFAYRIEMKWWMFAFAGLTAILISFLTIGSQSMKAAMTNPVNCLRDE